MFKIVGDTLFEQDEKFSVVLTDPINGAPGTDMRGEVTIDDDDSADADGEQPVGRRGQLRPN